MRIEKQPGGRGELHIMEKGETLNPNGRPRKYVSILKLNGYKLSEINDTIQIMMAMTTQELLEVFDNSESTVLEKTIANAALKSLEKGDLNSMETLLNRTFGKPKEIVQTEITGKGGTPIVTVSAITTDPIEASKLYQDMLNKD
jgi:hypothetical protein